MHVPISENSSSRLPCDDDGKKGSPASLKLSTREGVPKVRGEEGVLNPSIKPFIQC